MTCSTVRNTGINLPIHNLETNGAGWSTPLHSRLTPWERTPVLIVEEADWALGSVSTGVDWVRYSKPAAPTESVSVYIVF